MSKAINKLLVEKGYELFNRPKEFVEFTANKKANSLLNDLDNTPHAFVLACIMDRQFDAKLAWIIPYKLKDRIQKFDFLTLSKLSKDEIHQHFITPDNLHRFHDVMSNNFFSAIRHIETKYNGDASKIWKDNPSSAEVVHRFLEFDGVGPKIGTMAANILARDFKIHISDHYSIDISVDVQIRRVFNRLGLAPSGCSNDLITYKARAINPVYPGIFDFVCWEIGKYWCRPQNPTCINCYLHKECPSSNTRTGP